MKAWYREKRDFYASPDVSEEYDFRRFGGPSGTHVSNREVEIIASLLPRTGSVLDLGAGTGRLSLHLHNLGYRVTALDSSLAMLKLARSKFQEPSVSWLLGDAFSLPLQDEAFDAVVALRMAFHFPDLMPLCEAMAAAVKPGGTVIFDTMNWSPRAQFTLGRSEWGGRVFVPKSGYVEIEAKNAGMALLERKSIFLFSPYIYRQLPLSIVRLLDCVESVVPERLRTRRFWQFKRL